MRQTNKLLAWLSPLVMVGGGLAHSSATAAPFGPSIEAIGQDARPASEDDLSCSTAADSGKGAREFEVAFVFEDATGERRETLLLCETGILERAGGGAVAVADLTVGDAVAFEHGAVAHVVRTGLNAQTHVVPKRGHSSGAESRIVGVSSRTVNHLASITTGHETIVTTNEHPFFVRARGWVPASSLRPGDEVDAATASGRVAVIAVESHAVPARQVWNLLVSQTHTFRVGKDGLLAHNGACVSRPNVIADEGQGATGRRRRSDPAKPTTPDEPAALRIEPASSPTLPETPAATRADGPPSPRTSPEQAPATTQPAATKPASKPPRPGVRTDDQIANDIFDLPSEEVPAFFGRDDGRNLVLDTTVPSKADATARLKPNEQEAIEQFTGNELGWEMNQSMSPKELSALNLSQAKTDDWARGQTLLRNGIAKLPPSPGVVYRVDRNLTPAQVDMILQAQKSGGTIAIGPGLKGIDMGAVRYPDTAVDQVLKSRPGDKRGAYRVVYVVDQQSGKAVENIAHRSRVKDGPVVLPHDTRYQVTKITHWAEETDQNAWGMQPYLVVQVKEVPDESFFGGFGFLRE